VLDRVRLVLLTLGERGACAVHRRGCVCMACRLPQGSVRNTVGCGDAFLAGWLYARQRGEGIEGALRWAVAAGAASACGESTVGYTRQEVEGLLERCEPG